MANITFQGNPLNTNGNLPKVGDPAPEFTLVDGKLDDVSLTDFRGQKVLLNIVPSLDTPVCATSTKKFNQQTEDRDDLVVLVVSADLPFAQSRFCSAEHTDRVKTLSMMRNRHFARDYGVLIQDGPLAGITARAVVVIDPSGQVVYTQLVEEIADEPDYQRALAAV
ncbi:MAG: thiol peroxidase [Gammaproteobacteria bacterium]|nr:thiol peroxidase [Gammaproteobacteria bacterium]